MLLPVAISSRRMDGWMDGSAYTIIPEELLQLVLNSSADVMMMLLKLLKLGHQLPSQLPFPPRLEPLN